MKRALSSKDWLGKSSAGLILGFLLALGAGGLFKVRGSGGDIGGVSDRFHFAWVPMTKE